MKGSSKRTRELSDIQEACDLYQQILLAYCPTRSLSLGQCIPCLLNNYIPLLAFFSKNLSVDDTDLKALEAAASKHPAEENVPRSTEVKKVRLVIHQTASPPAQATSPPAQAASPPAQAASHPAQAASLPAQVANFPAQAASPVIL